MKSAIKINLHIQNSRQNHSEKRSKRNKVRLTSATKSIQSISFNEFTFNVWLQTETWVWRSAGAAREWHSQQALDSPRVQPLSFSGLREMAVSSNKAVTFSWKSPCCRLRCYSNKAEEIEVNILPSILHHLPHSFISHSDSPVFALLRPISVHFFYLFL